jgi:hypothetical protein
MRWSEITWTKHDLMPSHQARVQVGEYTLSIITEVTDSSLYECAIFCDGTFTQVAGIHPNEEEWSDDVLRFLTKPEVVSIVRKLEAVTGAQPENAESI